MEYRHKTGAHIWKDKDGNLIVERFGYKSDYSQGMGNSFHLKIKFLPKKSNVEVELQGWSCLPNHKNEAEKKYIKRFNSIEQERDDFERSLMKVELANEILSSIFNIFTSQLERKLHNII